MIEGLYEKLCGFSFFRVNGTNCTGLVPIEKTIGLSEIGFFTEKDNSIIYMEFKRKNGCPCKICGEVKEITNKPIRGGMSFKVLYEDGGYAEIQCFESKDYIKLKQEGEIK